MLSKKQWKQCEFQNIYDFEPDLDVWENSNKNKMIRLGNNKYGSVDDAEGRGNKVFWFSPVTKRVSR